MNDTRAGLEAALAANPDDAATHAAYADCLIEQGDPRGDYVRLQPRTRRPLAAGRTTPRDGAGGVHTPQPTTKPSGWGRWPNTSAPRPAGCAATVNIDVLEANVQVTYRRGWLDTVRVERLSPAVSAALTACPIAALTAELHLGSDHLSDVTALPLTNLVKLRWMQTDESELSLNPGNEAARPAGWFHPVAPAYFPAQADFSPRNLPRLRELALRWGNRGDDGVEFLLATGLIGQLRGLDLRQCNVTDDGARALAADPAVPRLDYLHLDENRISPIGIEALAAVGVAISQRQYLGPNPGFDDFGDNEGERIEF